ncbi:MAG: ATP-dependent Clp protease ATP-binding subunit [Candidatus Spechtbacterales bacterium]
MFFNLKKSQIYKAVEFQKSFYPEIWRRLRIVFFALGAAALLAFVLTHPFSFNIPFAPTAKDVPLLQEPPDIQGREVAPKEGQNVIIDVGDKLFLSDRKWKGFAYIFLPLGLFLLFFEGIFYQFYLKYPKTKNSENLADFLGFDEAMVLDDAFGVSKRLGEEAVSADSFLLAFSRYEPAKHLFLRLGIDPSTVEDNLIKTSPDVKQKFLSVVSTPWNREVKLSAEMDKLLVGTAKLRNEHGHERMTLADFLATLFDVHQPFQQMVVNLQLDKPDLVTLAIWEEHNRDVWEKKRRWWTRENLLNSSPIGAEWVYGYPSLLAGFSHDLTLPFRQRVADMKLVGRKQVMERMDQILTRGDKQNTLLVGESGVGKRAIVLRIAQNISEGKAPKELNYKKILELNVNAIVSSSSDRAEVQRILGGVLDEAQKVGNVILFIDSIHNFIGEQEGLGRTDISEILLPYIQSANMQMIATTTPGKFHQNISPRTDLLALLEKVDIEEPERGAVLRILEDEVLHIEARDRMFFMYAALKTIYEDANSFIQAVPFPEKGLSLLNEVVSYVKSQGKNIVEVEDVHAVVTRKTNMPLGAIGQKEKDKLMRLEEEMHKDIVGQEYAVKTIVRAMQRLRAGLTREEKPAGVFLFVGPTGVGKTLTSKVLANIYFGSSDKMIRFDMSEFQTLESVERMLGSLRQEYAGQLITAVRDNPFSVILLDEFEKAHKDLLNVFLRVFDEGKMTDVFGRKVNFQHNIIIATSNAGAAEIRGMVQRGENLEEGKQKLLDLFIDNGYFKPELLNRFDEIVIYHPLNEEQIKQVAQLMIGNLVERLKKKGYYYKPTPEVVDYVAKVGFDPQFGARPMARAIQDKLESYIARLILEDKIKKGIEFEISVGDLNE